VTYHLFIILIFKKYLYFSACWSAFPKQRVLEVQQNQDLIVHEMYKNWFFCNGQKFSSIIKIL